MTHPQITFLLGAGASYGAGDITPFPPPLGGDLYGELVQAFPQSWGELEDDEKGAFTETGFESGMKLLWEKYDERAWRTLIDMGIYFARFSPPHDHSDCYSRLVIALRARGLVDRTAVATLNYECLFEIASSRVGVHVNFSGQPNPNALSVAKPHGSCNFLAKINAQHLTLIGNPQMNNLLLAETEVVHNLEGIEPRYESGYSIPPVMAMYTESKHSPINGVFLDAMREDWKRWAAETDLIVAVGANPYFADTNVWDPVMRTPGRVWYVGGTGGDFESLAEGLGGRFEHLGDRFATSLPILLGRLDEFS